MHAVRSVIFVLFSFFFFSFSLVSPTYASSQIDDVTNEVIKIMKQGYLYWKEEDLEKCKKEVSRLISVKLAFENNEWSAEEANAALNEIFSVQKPCLDKFSNIMTPKEMREAQIRTSGSLVGIGTTLSGSSGRVVVMKVIVGSPAEAGGMRAGDILLRARNEGEDQFSEFANVADAVNKIRGAEGSTVFIVVERAGSVIELPAIRRHKIIIPSVEARIVGTVGYVAIQSFGEHTGDEFEDALARFQKQNIDRVIVDVRDNPGGLVASVLETLYYFSSNPRDVIMVERFRDGDDSVASIRDPSGRCAPATIVCPPMFAYPVTNEPKTPGRFEDMKIVVLVNKRSASASEIFAGTLKDWGASRKNIAIVGEPTYGKGVGQAIIPLEGGFSMAMTVFEYFVGNSRTAVNEIGVNPYYIVDDTRGDNPENTLTERDAQFKTGLSVLRELR